MVQGSVIWDGGQEAAYSIETLIFYLVNINWEVQKCIQIIVKYKDF